jgi:predicted nucleic acid-binding protein
MPDRLAIINTSPLLYLHQVDQLEILPQLYNQIVAPTAVEQELAVGKATSIDVPELSRLDWLQVQAVNPAAVPNVIDLGRGEAEVIALGLKNLDGLLILDDQLGRKIAKFYQLRYTGTLGVLIKAKQSGYLKAIAPIITNLKKQGMWLADEIIETALKLAGEYTGS